jgi:hypothetical protein
MSWALYSFLFFLLFLVFHNLLGFKFLFGKRKKGKKKTEEEKCRGLFFPFFLVRSSEPRSLSFFFFLVGFCFVKKKLRLMCFLLFICHFYPHLAFQPRYYISLYGLLSVICDHFFVSYFIYIFFSLFFFFFKK